MNIFDTELHFLAEKMGDSALKKKPSHTKIASTDKITAISERGQSGLSRFAFILGESAFLLALFLLIAVSGCSGDSQAEMPNSNLGDLPVSQRDLQDNNEEDRPYSKWEIASIEESSELVGSFKLGKRKKVKFWIDFSQLDFVSQEPKTIAEFSNCKVNNLTYLSRRTPRTFKSNASEFFWLKLPDYEREPLIQISQLLDIHEIKKNVYQITLDNKRLLERHSSHFDKGDEIRLYIRNKSFYSTNGDFSISGLTNWSKDCVEGIESNNLHPLWIGDNQNHRDYLKSHNSLHLVRDRSGFKFPNAALMRVSQKGFAGIELDRPEVPLLGKLRKSFSGDLFLPNHNKIFVKDTDEFIFLRLTFNNVVADQTEYIREEDLDSEGCLVSSIQRTQKEVSADTLYKGASLIIEGYEVLISRLIERGIANVFHSGDSLELQINLELLRDSEYTSHQWNGSFGLSHNKTLDGAAANWPTKGFVVNDDPESEKGCKFNNISGSLDPDLIFLGGSNTSENLWDHIGNNELLLDKLALMVFSGSWKIEFTKNVALLIHTRKQ